MKPRKVKVRVVGETKIVYKMRKPKPVSCGICNQPLKGVPRLRKAKLKHTAKTKKRPERAYGGVLCSKCARKEIEKKVRKEKDGI